MKILSTVVAATFLTAGAASAVTIDFDSGVAGFSGDNNLTSYTQGGFSFAISETDLGGQASSGANLFNSDSCDSNVQACNGDDDNDLVHGGQVGVSGNVLIRQQAGIEVDDDASGNGYITMTLLSGPAFSITGYSGIDGLFDILVDGIGLGSLGSLDNNLVGSVVFDTPSRLIGIGESFVIAYTGSGGVDNITLAPAPVPLPATALLLLAGVAGLGVARRRS